MRPQDQHDPGGRVRIRLDEGIHGEAVFSDCGRYRHLLVRDWTPTGIEPRACLWVGMNPSVADADQSDPTCHREQIFTRDWGYTRYVKANMLDWRATDPKDLPPDPELACSAQNLGTIIAAAAGCEIILLGFGRLHRRYHGQVARTINALRNTGKPLLCLGHNADGSAKHPLYLKKSLKPIPFLQG